MLDALPERKCTDVEDNETKASRLKGTDQKRSCFLRLYTEGTGSELQ